MRASRPRGRYAVILALLVTLWLVAGCGQSQADTTQAGDQEGDSAETLLQAFQNYGGDVQGLNADAPVATTELVNVFGTIPVYDLTQGNPPCAGYVQKLPSLVFTVGEEIASVEVAFVGELPTNLVVVAEGAKVFCDESAPFSMSPNFTLPDPAPGRYGVWVGRADVQEPIGGVLTVSSDPVRFVLERLDGR